MIGMSVYIADYQKLIDRSVITSHQSIIGSDHRSRISNIIFHLKFHISNSDRIISILFAITIDTEPASLVLRI